MSIGINTDKPAPLPLNYDHGKVGVVTVLFNSAPVLNDFFASVESQSYKNLAVYCVDNNSRDESASLCANRSGLYKVARNSENVGVAAGNNQGIRAALADGCEYALLLNNDVVFGPEMVEQLVNGLHLHKADMTTPLIYYHEPPTKVWYAGGGFQVWLGNKAVHYGEGTEYSDNYAEDRRVDYAPTCCVLINRNVFQQVGLMDERYFVYYDDADWMLRAKKAGLSLWLLPGAELWHKVSSLTGCESDFGIRFSYRNKAYFLYKHHNWLVASILGVGFCIYYALNLLLPRRRTKARLCLRSWLEGIRLHRCA